MTCHNATLNAANVGRIVATTDMTTVQELVAGGAHLIAQWTTGQVRTEERSPKTVKNYISAFVAFLKYLEVMGNKGTEAARTAATSSRRGIRRRVKAQEARTAAANAGRLYSYQYNAFNINPY